MATVDQEHPATPDSLLDTILAADAERAALLASLETADPEHMGEIWSRLMEIDADTAPARAAEILNGLGFSTADLERPMSEFSGGWRMRVALAAALFAALQSAQRVKQEAERAHLQSFVDRFKASAAKAAQAQSRVKRLAKMEPVATTVEERVSPFLLPSPPRPLAPPLMRLEGVEVGYGDDPPALRGLALRLDLDDRIGLLGVNGAGKSTFAKMAAGALGIRSGRMTRSSRMEVGWFHQHQIEALDPEQTPLDIMREARLQDSDQSHRSRLAQFGIGFDKQNTTTAALSGGERARLLLNLVAMAAPHLLILDEPTNHLDIDSRRALLDALNEYGGAVILITHDRSLMELVADRLWLAADNTVAPFDGDMDDYARFVLDRARGGTAAPSQAAAREKRAKKQRRA